MIALQITDLRSFTKHLFTQNTFDGFWLSEAAVQTSAALIIEGKTDPAFFSDQETTEEEEKTAPAPYLNWGEAKHYCYEWIRGRSLPLHFRMVFRDPGRQDNAAFLNIRYEREQPLRVTTGYTAKEFTMDRSDEKLWDEEVRAFFTDHEIDFEEL